MLYAFLFSPFLYDWFYFSAYRAGISSSYLVDCFMAFNSIYKFVFLHFTFRYSTLLISSSLYATSFCNNPLPSLIFTYSLSVSASYTLLVAFLVVFFVSSNLHLIILKLYLNTGMTNTPISVMSSLALNTDFSIILNFLVYSICSLSFIC